MELASAGSLPWASWSWRRSPPVTKGTTCIMIKCKRQTCALSICLWNVHIHLVRFPNPLLNSGVQPVYCLHQPLYLRALELLGQLQRLQLCDTSPFDAVTSTWQFNFDVNCLVVFFTWASQGKALVDLIVQSADLHFGEICYRLASHNLHCHCWRPSWLSCHLLAMASILTIVPCQFSQTNKKAWFHLRGQCRWVKPWSTPVQCWRSHLVQIHQINTISPGLVLSPSPTKDYKQHLDPGWLLVSSTTMLGRPRTPSSGT